MALGIVVANNMTHDAVVADDRRTVADAQFFHTVFLALFQHVVALAHFAVVVGQQLHREAMPVAKRCVANAIVA